MKLKKSLKSSPVGTRPVSSFNVKVGSTTTTTSETCQPRCIISTGNVIYQLYIIWTQMTAWATPTSSPPSAAAATTTTTTTPLCELSSAGGEWYFDGFAVEILSWN